MSLVLIASGALTFLWCGEEGGTSAPGGPGLFTVQKGLAPHKSWAQALERSHKTGPRPELSAGFMGSLCTVIACPHGPPLGPGPSTEASTWPVYMCQEGRSSPGSGHGSRPAPSPGPTSSTSRVFRKHLLDEPPKEPKSHSSQETMRRALHLHSPRVTTRTPRPSRGTAEALQDPWGLSRQQQPGHREAARLTAALEM